MLRHACRYVWLPLWVLDRNEWGSDKITSLPPAPGSMIGSPADVIVKWKELWRISDLDPTPEMKAPVHSATALHLPSA